MKATIDIPDEVYRRVKAKSALQGRPVREVTVELYRRWLAGELDEPRYGAEAQGWLERFLKAGEQASKTAPEGPTATEILDEDRDRLDRP